MRFHATSVSASANGDYYQLWLGADDVEGKETVPFEVKGPYLILQRQFETSDGGRAYIETHDEDYIGHFRVLLAELSRTRLAFEILRKANNRVEVSFRLTASEFEEIRRVAEIVFGLREPEDDDAL